MMLALQSIKYVIRERKKNEKYLYHIPKCILVILTYIHWNHITQRKCGLIFISYLNRKDLSKHKIKSICIENKNKFMASDKCNP